jgi:UDP-glucose 4-epimerase
MRKIAITGAGGMTGKHMVSLLKEKEISFVALTRSDWDICQWKSFDELDLIFRSCEAVFHFAAQLPGVSSSTSSIFNANVRSCLNLAEWAASRVIPLVFLSGATVYKDSHKAKISEMEEKVVNGFGGFYGYSKLLAENIIEHYRSEGLKAVILRPSSIYGYGLSAEKLISKYLSLAQNGRVIELLQPDNRINLIHAYDVARAALSAYESNCWGVFNIGAQSYSVSDIAKMAIRISGKGEISTAGVDQVYEPFKRFDLDCSLAKVSFGFQPVIDLEEGMKLMMLRKERA